MLARPNNAKKKLALSARAYLIGAIDEDSRCGFPFSRLLEGRNSCRREDFFLHFSDHLFDETKLSTVQHKCIRENPRTVKVSREILNQVFPSLYCFYPFQTPSRSRKHTQTLFLLQEGCQEYA